MSFIGKWIFHSIGVMGEDGLTYMTADEYLNSPIPYVDETDEEAVAEEIKERKQMIGSCIEVCDDGNLYMLMPIPEGVTQDEIDEAVKAGEITLRSGMLFAQAMAWEERDGNLWFNSGMESEIFDEASDPWVCATDEEGFFVFITTRYVKEEK